jgi:hypothetical protein
MRTCFLLIFSHFLTLEFRYGPAQSKSHIRLVADWHGSLCYRQQVDIQIMKDESRLRLRALVSFSNHSYQWEQVLAHRENIGWPRMMGSLRLRRGIQRFLVYRISITKPRRAEKCPDCLHLLKQQTCKWRNSIGIGLPKPKSGS